MTLPENLVLARTSEVAVLVSAVTAYPIGFSFLITGKARHGFSSELSRDWYGSPYHFGVDPVPEGFLRIGVEFADGQRITNLRPEIYSVPTRIVGGQPVPDLVLVSEGGSSDGWEFQRGYWVWPLPPEGDVRFVCEWPGAGIGVRTQTIDGGRVRDAADRCEWLWPEDRESGEFVG